MDPSLGLLAASGLVNFLLKSTAEWLVCLLLVRLAGSARTRFKLWLTMLLGFVAQWAWMLACVVRAASPAAGRTAVGLARAAATGERIAVASAVAGTVAEVMAVLLAGYGAMLVWRLAGALAARLRLGRAMRHRSAPDGLLAASFQEAMAQTAHRGGLGGCELWVLPGLSSPATVGWLRPRVILPPVCSAQDAAELKVVFWHELKHVERRDALWNAIVRACRNLLWFHPCVHHATAALNAERELACDAAVVDEHPHSRDVYASCLVRFARQRDLSPESAVTGIEIASGAALLTARVRSILSEGQGTSRAARLWRGGVSVLLVAGMAATVPALNVLFAPEAIGAIQLPLSNEVRIAAKRGLAKPAAARPLHAVTLQAAGLAEVAAAMPPAMQHDEGLAAEHRAAMEVLTESTGMEAPSLHGDGRVSANVGGPPVARANAGQANASWASLAVDAAEKAGPLMLNDHDADDRH